MILINNQWEMVNDIYDVLRICEENINDEFAKKVEGIFDDAIYNAIHKCENKEGDKKIISNPKYGWCDFKLGDFEGHPSYLTDVPVDILDAFINYHTNGCGIACFDEEGTNFILILSPYSVFIIEEKDKPILHYYEDIDVWELENELINDIESNIDEWAVEFVTSDTEQEIKEHRMNIEMKVDILKNIVRR